MTISTQPTFQTYAGADLAGPFTIPFRFDANSEVVVKKTSALGVTTTLTGNVITGAGEATGGQLTTAEAVATGETLLIYRAVPITQPADYIAADAFPAETHEAALDRLTMIAQDLKREVDRAYKKPIGSTSPADTDDIIDAIADEVTDDALIAALEAAGAEQLALVQGSGASIIEEVETASADAINDVEAAGVTATALIEDAARAMMFNTPTNGLTVAGEGQDFTVIQASGLGLDWYRDVSGVAHFLQKISPGPGAEFITQLMVLERSPHVCLQYPWTPRMDVRWGDARLYDGAVAPDRSHINLTPHRAINAFACGYIPNATGSESSPTHTALYEEGPTVGVHDSMNYTYGTNQQLYLVRTSSLAVDIPDQVMTLVFDHKREGGSDQTLQAGLSTALDTAITAGAAWTNQYKRQLTWAGANDIVIRSGGSAADVNLARVFIWPGPSASVPAWADMNFVGGRSAYAFTNALLLSGAAATTVASGRSFIVYDPDYKSGGHTYQRPLFSHTFRLDPAWAGGPATIIGTEEDGGHGTDAVGVNPTVGTPGLELFIETAAGFEGLVSPEYYSLGTRDFGSVDLRGGVICQVAQYEDPDDDFKAMFIDGTITFATTEMGVTSAPFDVSVVRVMSGNEAHTPEITLRTVPGESYATLVDDVPAGKTVEQLSALLHSQTEKLKLDPTVTRRVGFPLHLNIIGDSNDSGSGDWNTLVRAYNFLGDGYYPLPYSNHASGGDGAQVNSGFQGQWLHGVQWESGETDERCGARQVIRSRLATRRPCLTAIRGVTNDSVYLEANGAAALFNNYYLPLYEDVLAEGDLSWLLISSPLAHGSSKGAAYQTQRLLFADLQAAWAADYPGQVWFADVTRDPVMGSTVEASNPASIYFTQPGGLHLQSAGALALANIYKTHLRIIQAYALSLGY